MTARRRPEASPEPLHPASPYPAAGDAGDGADPPDPAGAPDGFKFTFLARGLWDVADADGNRIGRVVRRHVRRHVGDHLWTSAGNRWYCDGPDVWGHADADADYGYPTRRAAAEALPGLASDDEGEDGP